MVKKISGKNIASSISYLVVNGCKKTSYFEIANEIGRALEFNSSSANYSPEFLTIKAAQERIRLDFSTNQPMSYNIPFSMDELTDSIRKGKDSAPGADQIHYQFLVHLPVSVLEILLESYNKIWTTGSFPDCWREAIIIPLLKPGKDETNPNSYRPIALTSCLCKIMERMVNNRLMWFLESNKLLSPIQNGFRAGRSTEDSLITLETSVREAFVQGNHTFAVFFDLEKRMILPISMGF